MILVRDTIPCTPRFHLRSDSIESLWVVISPQKIPRDARHILLGTIYHPSKARDAFLTDYISLCIDKIKSKHCNTAVMIAGDFNTFKEGCLCRMYSLKQIVWKPTRDNSILDKVYTSIPQWYKPPDIVSHIGKSDHNSVLLSPKQNKNYSPTNRVVTTRCASYHNRLNLRMKL